MATKKFMQRFTDALFPSSSSTDTSSGGSNEKSKQTPNMNHQVTAAQVSVIVANFVDQSLINSTLTDDCLGLVFERLTLKDLLTVRQVCKRWFVVQEGVARQQKVLHIEGRDRVERDDWDRLVIPALDAEICNRLLGMFPNVHTLSIMFARIDTDELIYLLTKWRTTLRSITLRHFVIVHWEPVMAAFNSMVELRELTMIDMEMFDYPRIGDCDFTVVCNQLDSFQLEESMSDRVFDLIVNRASKDKVRKFIFDISDRKFAVVSGDVVALRKVKDQYESTPAVYLMFQDMIPKQYQTKKPRGIYSDIPVKFGFTVIKTKKQSAKKRELEGKK